MLCVNCFPIDNVQRFSDLKVEVAKLDVVIKKLEECLTVGEQDNQTEAAEKAHRDVLITRTKN